MTTTEAVAPVRQSVKVPLDQAQAFELYVDRFDSWWPHEHHIGEVEPERVIIEPKTGGRVYEIGVDGTECDWGYVKSYDPPSGFVAAWQLNAEWQYDADRSKASEYEVTFEPQDDGSTLVTLEHRCFENHGEGGASIAAAVGTGNGWPGLLQMYAETA